MTPLPDDVRVLFEGPNYAHVATVMPNGAPHSVPVWTILHGDRIAFFTQPSSRKARNIEADARVAISILDFQQPYHMASVRGSVTETLEGDEALAVIDAISQKYTGRDFPMRSGIVYLVEPERSQSMQLPFQHTPPSS
jgi:PPOX class probable F420-dependent enzyme